jgi:hypothetical protein
MGQAGDYHLSVSVDYIHWNRAFRRFLRLALRAKGESLNSRA